jgi:SAM-dependent methyltransferase
VKGKEVLDIACGEGYGSSLLSKYASKVYGIDIDTQSIEHAQRKYVKTDRNLKFIKGSTSEIPLEDKCIDIVISFETIEHHNEHEQMMREIKRVLREDGKLLISSPEKSIYSERDANNPFHIQELSFDDFKRLIETYFNHSLFFTQRFVGGSLIQSAFSDSFKTYHGNYDEIQDGLSIGHVPFYNKPYFNLAICSDTKIDDLSFASFFDGANVLVNEMNEVKKKYNIIRKSPEYKIGKALISKLPFLKRLLKK